MKSASSSATICPPACSIAVLTAADFASPRLQILTPWNIFVDATGTDVDTLLAPVEKGCSIFSLTGANEFVLWNLERMLPPEGETGRSGEGITG